MKKLRISTPADVLAVMNHILGVTPQESFVVTTLQGGRLGATLRVNIPTGMEPAVVVAQIVDSLRHDEDATGTLVAVYTDAAGTHPHSAYVNEIEVELLAAGMPVRECWLVTSAGWRSYFDTDAAVTALDSITDSAANAELIFSGSNPEAGKAQDREYVGAPGNAATITVLAKGFTDVDALDMSAPVMKEARGAWVKALGTTPDTARTCLLVAYVQNVVLRDRIMADFINTDDNEYAAVLIGETTTRPNWQCVDQAETLLVELLAQAPGKFRAPLYTMLGHLTWYKGRASMAAEHMEKALDAAPGYRLAALFKELLDHGALPKVAMHKGLAYPGAS